VDVAAESNCLINVHHCRPHRLTSHKNLAMGRDVLLARLLILHIHVWPFLIVAAWRNGETGHHNAGFP
jgi:hypothetical protein